MAYGATEPQAGSDLAALRSTAERVVRRTVSSSATGSPAPSSGSGTAASPTSTPSWPTRPAGRAGSSSSAARPASRTASPRTSTASAVATPRRVTCEDVFVPADQLVGGVEGQGLVQAQLVFGYTRLMVAAFGLGAGWAALDRAIPYSKERIQEGGPLSEKQGYTHKLIVPHAVALEAARAYIEETARAARRGRRHAQHRGRDRQVPRHRGRQRRGRRRHPGARRLRLHARVHGREDQARRAHHPHLRGHVRDHGDDDRPRPLAGPPEDARPLLPRAGGGRSRRSHERHPDGRARARRRWRSTRSPSCSSGRASRA